MDKASRKITKNRTSCPVGEPGQEGYTETTKDIFAIGKCYGRSTATCFDFPEETFQQILLNNPLMTKTPENVKKEGA